MVFKQAALAVLLLAVGGMAQGAEPARLRLITEASAPISMMEGRRVIGSGADKVVEIMARTGTRYTLEMLPWKRGYTIALQHPDACLFSTTRTTDRENLFKWIGPTDEAEWVLLGRTDRRYDLRTLEDARGLRIGTYHGDARDQYLRERGFRVDSAPNDMMNPRKLLMNRIDVWAASLTRGATVLKRYDWGDKIVPVLSFNRVGVYLACNPAVPTELVDRMNAAVDAMVRDGTMKRIDRKYQKWVDDIQPKR